VLVYFYPKADTPGCTAQACSLRDAYTDLLQEGVTVIGVSHDSPAAQKNSRKSTISRFSLIADTDGAVAKAFQVPTVVGFTKRQAFLIRDGKSRLGGFPRFDREASRRRERSIAACPPELTRAAASPAACQTRPMRLLLIDGALLARTLVHAIRDLSNSRGEPTNAILVLRNRSA